MSFAFSFSGDDIEDTHDDASQEVAGAQQPGPASGSLAALRTDHQAQGNSSAFPIEGKPQLAPNATAQTTFCLGELWDVRVQLMAEDDGSGRATEGLGAHDVKTGVYEGGFKSWESSVDLVKVLATRDFGRGDRGQPLHVIELGCGTALPSLAIFQQTLLERMASTDEASTAPALYVTVADYNPTVLQLVTLPNFILTWALLCKETDPALADAFSMEDELELTDEVKEGFCRALSAANIHLSWLSGGWSSEFVDLLYAAADGRSLPAPLTTLERQARPGSDAQALVGAKRHYFGVGGSLDDFVGLARDGGFAVEQLAEETEGVRRGVVQCTLAAQSKG
ncbi:unnamed protein product [Parascedosporium putredinis]|uniref:protein-histidine N-methyltransferase n=1 Tax=Parascedosporium putredinis TaxID=1442378 RepID=A0A9P1H3T9_9PEZI|nr:unnamed protein product [Parascedosporium putredinis]CAI7997564.1 unnamed protein product [Parascedosporium putredinis]